MIRIGIEPFLECSSKGDKRFSAFYANVNGKSIEEQYQAAKIFLDGSTGLYKALWKQYLMESPELLKVLKNASGLSDVFGQAGSNCQALTLWELRNNL